MKALRYFLDKGLLGMVHFMHNLQKDDKRIVKII